MNRLLNDELQYRAQQGLHPVSIEQFNEAFSELGYRIDRSLECRSVAHHLSGERKGSGYPSITTRVKEADTGLSAFHVDARRDVNFEMMQQIRQQVFAVTDGAILEV